MKIEIWSDFSCPFCYIGKKRFEKALSQFEHAENVEVTFKAYQLNPSADKFTELSASEIFAKSHHMSVEEANKRFDQTVQNAKTVGLEFHYDQLKMTNTFDAHRLAKWSSKYELEPKLTERLMKAYFTDGLNLADVETLVMLASEVGLDKDMARKILIENQFEKDVRNEINEAKRIGVQGVPFFVVNRKYGISGAQQEDYFLAALNQIWDEDHPSIPKEDAKTTYCTGDDCDL